MMIAINSIPIATDTYQKQMRYVNKTQAQTHQIDIADGKIVVPKTKNRYHSL